MKRFLIAYQHVSLEMEVLFKYSAYIIKGGKAGKRAGIRHFIKKLLPNPYPGANLSDHMYKKF